MMLVKPIITENRMSAKSAPIARPSTKSLPDMITDSIDRLDWATIAIQLDREGYALLPGLLTAEQTDSLLRQAADMELHREIITGGHGRGERFFLPEPLSGSLDVMRTHFYTHLVRIANHWNELLQMPDRYPRDLAQYLDCNRDCGQVHALSHLNRLGQADNLTLEQYTDGKQIFPMQIVALLSRPDMDFGGGEFVMTEQRPRMQSRPMVLPLRQGDAAIIATAQRPFKGSKGYYRVQMRHAVSRVRRGERIGLELFFHNAPCH